MTDKELADSLNLKTEMARTALVQAIRNLMVFYQKQQDYGSKNIASWGSSKRLVTFSSTTKTTGLQPGYTVTGTGIPAGTTITSIDSATTLTLSADTTGGNLSSQTPPVDRDWET